jgi:peptidoglycan/LPS O-acetylase OafA/YrhL
LHGLFPQANNSVVPGGWSIGTEVLFYLSFPFLFWWLDSPRRILQAWVGHVILLLCLVLSGLLYVGNNSFAYFNILVQMPVFLSGFLLYRLRNNNQYLLQAIGLFVCFFACFSLWFYWRFQPIRFLLLPATSGLLFCFVGLHLAKLRNIPQIITEIGRRSYSMYIFHFLASWHLAPLIDKGFTGMLGGNVSLFINFSVSTILTFWLAGYSFKYLEKPFVIQGNRIIEKHFQ